MGEGGGSGVDLEVWGRGGGVVLTWRCGGGGGGGSGVDLEVWGRGGGVVLTWRCGVGGQDRRGVVEIYRELGKYQRRRDELYDV